MGAPNATGIYEYDETDDAYPVSDLLNRVGRSVTDLLNAPWTSYVPSLSGVTLGNGTLVARTKRLGRTTLYRGRLVFGSSTSMTGWATIGLPVSLAVASDTDTLGSVTLLDRSANLWIPGTARLAGGASVAGLHTSTGGFVGPGAPFTWTTGDAFSWNFTLESA